MTRRQIVTSISAIVALAVIAAFVGAYIFLNQRVRPPWVKVYDVKVALPTAQALTPGQGQEVTVAGVKVGQVAAVDLEGGRAVVTLQIKRDLLDAVHADATALVRPKTGLQDMTVDIDPGSKDQPKLEGDDVLPVERGTPSVNVDEVIAGLDADVRPYAQSLLLGLGRGLQDGGAMNLRALLKRTQPLLTRTRDLTTAVAERRVAMKRLVTNLSKLSDRVAGQSEDLTALVSQADATFAATSAESEALQRSLAQLPPTLGSADDMLAQLRPLSQRLTPTLRDLRPAANGLDEALDSARTLARTGRPTVGALRALSRDAQGPARNLSSALRATQSTLPDLSRSLDVVRYATNVLAFEPDGDTRSYLFWLAWFGHNVSSMLSTQDANGGGWRGQLIFSCSNVDALGLLVPILQPAADAGICPK